MIERPWATSRPSCGVQIADQPADPRNDLQARAAFFSQAGQIDGQVIVARDILHAHRHACLAASQGGADRLGQIELGQIAVDAHGLSEGRRGHAVAIGRLVVAFAFEHADRDRQRRGNQRVEANRAVFGGDPKLPLGAEEETLARGDQVVGIDARGVRHRVRAPVAAVGHVKVAAGGEEQPGSGRSAHRRKVGRVRTGAARRQVGHAPVAEPSLCQSSRPLLPSSAEK